MPTIILNNPEKTEIQIDGTTLIKSFDSKGKYYIKIYVKESTTKGYPLGGIGQCTKKYYESYDHLYNRNKRLKKLINLIYYDTM